MGEIYMQKAADGSDARFNLNFEKKFLIFL